MGAVGGKRPRIQSRIRCGSQDATTAIRGLRRVPHPCNGTAENSARPDVSENIPESQNNQNPIFMNDTTNHKAKSNRLRYRRSVWFLHLVTVGVVCIAGCLNPQNTRFPSWHSQFPAAENAAYGRQDPFPDPDIGPSTDSSPRGYERPRSTARQAAEQRLLQGLPVGPESVPPGVPQGSRNSDQAVY